MGAFVISPLPPVLVKESQTAGPLRSAGITPPHRSYGPLRRPLTFGRLPGVSGYTAYLSPPLSRRGEEGFSSCSTCPCHRSVAPTPPERPAASAVATVRAAFALRLGARPPGLRTFGATTAFTLVTARWLA